MPNVGLVLTTLHQEPPVELPRCPQINSADAPFPVLFFEILRHRVHHLRGQNFTRIGGVRLETSSLSHPLGLQDAE